VCVGGGGVLGRAIGTKDVNAGDARRQIGSNKQQMPQLAHQLGEAALVAQPPYSCSTFRASGTRSWLPSTSCGFA
jgi:hypothetical protein